MRALLEPLPRADGVACFTRLYLEVTTVVQAELAGAGFADPRFLERLDVVFAGLFFETVDADAGGSGDVPAAWRPLFEARSRRGIAPLQFALAGMNAHINRDLAVALATVWDEADIDPRPGSPQHADFERVNEILARVEQRVRGEYLTGWLNALDRRLHRFDRIGDVLAMWDVRRARATAWVNGAALWAMREDERLAADFLRGLDRFVAFSSRGLLVPADTALSKVRRGLRRLQRDPLWWV